MRKSILTAAATVALVLAPAVASAQDQQFCEPLFTVLKASHNHFNDIRGGKKDKDEWETSVKLAHATSCDIEKMTGSDRMYSCEYDLASRTDNDTATIKNLVSAYTASILQCQPAWHTEMSGTDTWIVAADGNKFLMLSPYSSYFYVSIGDH